MPVASTAPVGYALPAIRGAGGYFPSKNKYDTAWGDVIIAIMCPIGGRPMRRAFGSGLADTLFDFSDDRSSSLIKKSLTSAINTYVPHVNVINIDVQRDGKSVTVLVEFSLREEPSKVVQRAVKIDKRTTMNTLAVRSR